MVGNRGRIVKKEYIPGSNAYRVVYEGGSIGFGTDPQPMSADQVPAFPPQDMEPREQLNPESLQEINQMMDRSGMATGNNEAEMLDYERKRKLMGL